MMEQGGEVPYGCYIQDTTGKLWTSDAWDGSATPNGVAVVTEDCSFVIALSWESYSPIDADGYSSKMKLPVYDSEDAAITDYSGSSNTTAMISAYGNDSSEAAGTCRDFTFPNGKKGYLGAAGEWQAAYDNKSAVETCMSAAGGTTIGRGSYWSSTRTSDARGYNCFWRLGWNNYGRWDGNLAYSDFYTRAFCAL